MVLALLMLKASPKQLFVVNSEIGLKMVAKYGRALRNIMKIHCAFFSESPGAIGAPYSARYLRDVIPHSTIISDNQPAIDKWKSRLGRSVDRSFACIPNHVALPSDAAFERIVSSRIHRPRSLQLSALWLSRWEPFKATDVLLELLRRTPSLHVDAYGPVAPGLDLQKLPRNIEMVGSIASPDRIEVSQYDLMVFTSFFEGMPNAVLEMAALGLPIVASAVGGLRDTFGDDTIALVDMEGDTGTIAERFRQQIDRLMSESPAELKARLTRTRAKLIQHHGLPEVTQKVLSLA
jgi:glycosyltransferase involved in cell wall biosynthesis